MNPLNKSSGLDLPKWSLVNAIISSGGKTSEHLTIFAMTW